MPSSVFDPLDSTVSGPSCGIVHDRSDPVQRAWVAHAVRLIEADLQRSADTHLLRFPLPFVGSSDRATMREFLLDGTWAKPASSAAGRDSSG